MHRVDHDHAGRDLVPPATRLPCGLAQVAAHRLAVQLVRPLNGSPKVAWLEIVEMSRVFLRTAITINGVY